MKPSTNLLAAHPIAVLILLLLLPVSTIGQGTTGTIQGSVTEQETGKPIAALTVGLFKPDGTPTLIGAFTNAEGEFIIINVPPGRYLLRASMQLYRAKEIADVLVSIGVTTQRNFQLEKSPPNGSIDGIVTDQVTNSPIAAVDIDLINLDGTTTPLGDFTNADGEYEIINVPTGRYLLRASMVGYHVIEVQNLLVTTGVVTHQHFQLEDMIGISDIIGTVVDKETGEPIVGANVILSKSDDTRTTIGAFTNDAGAYRIIDILPGRYLLRAIMPNYKTIEVTDLILTEMKTTRLHFKLERVPPH